MGSLLLPATNALSLSAGLATSMKGRKEINHVLSVKPDTSASKVSSFVLYLKLVIFNYLLIDICF